MGYKSTQGEQGVLAGWWYDWYWSLVAILCAIWGSHVVDMLRSIYTAVNVSWSTCCGFQLSLANHLTTLHHSNHTTVHYTTLYNTTVHYTTVHHTSLYHTILHLTTLPTPQFTLPHYTTLHYTPHNPTLHRTTHTTAHYTTSHYNTPHPTALD